LTRAGSLVDAGGMRVLAIAMVASLCAAAVAHADGEAVDGFPRWEERVMHEWTNRARVDPQVEMQACGTACGERACYQPQQPLPMSAALNRAARFHSDEMKAQAYFAHDSACTVVADIATKYPATCTGAASCACVGGTKACSPTCTAWSQRVALFGATPSGEIIASSTDPNTAFYQWLFEPYNKTTCGYDQGPPTNGHRFNLLMAGPAVGFGGGGGGAAVGDFGSGGTPAKLISGAHYPRAAATVEAWANWRDAAGPKSALVNVDGTCSPMMLGRGAVTNGAYRAQITGVGTGCHRYFFVFHDASDAVVTYPTTGSLGIGPAGSCADWDTSRPPTGAGCDCTPQCTGKQCGDDGCGGSCGGCTGTDTCESNACVGSGGGGSNNPDGGTGGGGDGSSTGCGCGSASGAGALWLGVVALVLRRRRRPAT
jgi:MYXO-CTERM domain-containing protein